MKSNTIHPQLLCQLSRQLSSGNALLAVATLNEYLHQSHPLHRAFVTRAHQVTDPETFTRDVTRTVLSGACLRELSEQEREEIFQLSKNSKVPSKVAAPNFNPNPRRRNGWDRRVAKKPGFHAFRQRAKIDSAPLAGSAARSAVFGC